MKLRAEIDGETYDVQFTRDDDIVMATVNGRQYRLETSEPEPNVFLFKNDSKISEVSVTPGNPGITYVRNGTHEFEVKITDPKRLRGSSGESTAVDGTAEIRSAMPGKVVRIVSEVGSTVSKGDGVIVVEAMKMQNELKTPKDGVVKEIRFQEGATVNSGDLLAVIE